MELIIEKTIAKGGQGIICQTTFEGKKVAMKIDYKPYGKTNFSPLRTEFNYLNQFDHENIVRVYQFIAPTEAVKVILPMNKGPEFVKISEKLIKFRLENDYFVLEKRAIMLLELCEDEFFEVVLSNDGISDMETARDYFCQICRGVKALHDQGLVNYDIKLENVLINDGKLKICDLGLSEPVNRRRMMKIGTDNAMAPEMHLGGMFGGPVVDIFSLGVLLYSMIFARFPWNHTML